MCFALCHHGGGASRQGASPSADMIMLHRLNDWCSCLAAKKANKEGFFLQVSGKPTHTLVVAAVELEQACLCQTAELTSSLLQGWNKLSVELCTHARQGLTSNDFVMAAKINQLPMEDLLRKKKKKLADA